ncbi:helix-turn-helix domain-containing protein [Paenibacillus sp. GD4]|jgi:DNA-binding HxlR family transcriptional regulator|uniref:winged helix-turn-helix transcriptional regulator n=1 Tax=Paenibacillus sp. GD4 TaxID=3068890 RepID=UPI002796C8EF|nr:helix-turn-helix domain-containing protein [Paenibacillus sp. GD4]MDQ1909846.1 helix-turn-helix domain-containing protein [Paenibacillus sp. GD4]
MTLPEKESTVRQQAASNYIPKQPVHIECSIERALDVIGGKWSFLVLRELFGGTMRFGELQRKIVSISPKSLTDTLRHLEENGVLERTAYPTVPVTVEYKLTPKGEDLHQILKEMKLWAAKWCDTGASKP